MFVMGNKDNSETSASLEHPIRHHRRCPSLDLDHEKNNNNNNNGELPLKSRLDHHQNKKLFTNFNSFPVVEEEEQEIGYRNNRDLQFF